MTVNDYLNLITSEHRDKPDFSAMIADDVALPIRIQDLFTAMIPLYDVDLARGTQLDVIGQWVGITRNVSIPVAGVYFSWDADYTLGWDYGSWKDNSQPATIVTLPDDAYRTLIRAKIAANHWDGTTDGAYAIWDAVFTNVTILIQDHQNMSYDMVLVGGIIDSLTLALLTGGYLPLKPEGVRINEFIVPVNTGPLFGWDIDNQYLKGWETGSWGREIDNA